MLLFANELSATRVPLSVGRLKSGAGLPAGNPSWASIGTQRRMSTTRTNDDGLLTLIIMVPFGG